jgi:hypothetical protein
MSIVALEKLEHGMVLASEVSDKSGRLLLGAGGVLEDKHLRIFRTWGVVEADIEGVAAADSDALPDNITQEQLELAKTRLLPLYCHADIEHPAICELFRLAVIQEVHHD